MAARTFEIVLTGFEFPAGLENNRANFRFVVDIRYANADGEFGAEHVVMPGLDTFWECATDKSAEPNFVRDAAGARFDMALIDAWDRLVLLISAERLHSLQVKVFDVNRTDAWDKIKEAIGPLIESAFGRLKTLTTRLPSFISNALGSAAEDVQSFSLKKLAGGGDKVLYRGSAPLPNPAAGSATPVAIQGSGSKGNYRVQLQVSS